MMTSLVINMLMMFGQESSVLLSLGSHHLSLTAVPTSGVHVKTSPTVAVTEPIDHV